MEGLKGLKLGRRLGVMVGGLALIAQTLQGCTNDTRADLDNVLKQRCQNLAAGDPIDKEMEGVNAAIMMDVCKNRFGLEVTVDDLQRSLAATNAADLQE